MALRLSKVFGRTPEGLLKLQLQYDLWQIEQKVDLNYLKKLRQPKLYSCSKLDEIFHKNLEIVKWRRESLPHSTSYPLLMLVLQNVLSKYTPFCTPK